MARIIKNIKCFISFESGFECIGACQAEEANLCSKVNLKNVLMEKSLFYFALCV